MKAAFTIWNDRIAPVFDVSGHAVVVQRGAGDNQHQQVALPAGSALDKLVFLHQMHVRVLVCGAITQTTLLTAQAYGIEVFPFVAGWQQEIVHCWLQQQPFENRFTMPGCQRGCQRLKNRCRRGRGTQSDPPFSKGEQ